MDTKRCSRCGNEYPATAEWFKKDKRTASGLASICKPCAAAYTRSWYKRKLEEDPEYHRHVYEIDQTLSELHQHKTFSEIVERIEQQGVNPMAGWAQTIIVGNVGRDPVLKYTQSGVAVCDFSVAVTRRFGGRDGNERREKTTWYRVTCWRQQAEIANQYVRKGTQIMVVGTVEASAYLDKAGQPAATLELTADNFQLLGSRADVQAATGGQEDYGGAPPDDMNDIPF